MRMSDLEKAYYDNPSFWESGALGLQDQIRVTETAKFIQDDVKTLLDAGCGNGIFCNYLLKERPAIDVTGLDRSPAALEHVNAVPSRRTYRICRFPTDRLIVSVH